MADVTAVHPPASPGRQEVRILYAAQTGVAPPTFVFFTNVATTFHFSYERFLQNRLRDAFGFVGTPIRIHVRRRAGRTKKGVSGRLLPSGVGQALDCERPAQRRCANRRV